MNKHNILRLREDHDLTQDALAKRIRCSKRSIQRWEAGETITKSWKAKLERLAERLSTKKR